MNHSYIGKIILNESQIQNGVRQVAAFLNSRYEDAVIIIVVPGGILFSADLIRQLNFDVSLDYISCPHTPGERHNQSDIIYHQNISLEDRHVILIDDAIESGGTMKRLVHHIQETTRPRSLAIATLFVKPSRVEIQAPQYYAYEMPTDDLLIGYGLPWQDKYRNLPYIAQLKTKFS